MDNENIASVMLSDTNRFVIGENYRFCLVLIERLINDQRDLTIGCSNQTKLKQIENNTSSDNISTMKPSNETSNSSMDSDSTSMEDGEEISDISSLEKISQIVATLNTNEQNDFRRIDGPHMPTMKTPLGAPTTTVAAISVPPSIKNSTEHMYASRITYGFDGSIYPGIFIGILITIVFTLVFIAAKLSNSRRLNNATVCYAAADQHSNDIENSNRYLKLQATTTL